MKERIQPQKNLTAKPRRKNQTSRKYTQITSRQSPVISHQPANRLKKNLSGRQESCIRVLLKQKDRGGHKDAID
jgi:hypothetical protein